MSERFSYAKERITKTTSFRLTEGELDLLKQMSEWDRVPMRVTISNLIKRAAKQRGFETAHDE